MFVRLSDLGNIKRARFTADGKLDLGALYASDFSGAFNYPSVSSVASRTGIRS